MRDTYLICVTDSPIQAVHIGDQENSKKEEDTIPESEVRCNNLDATNTWTPLTHQTDGLTKWDGFIAGVLRFPTDTVNVDLINERHGNRAEISDLRCKEEEEEGKGQRKYDCQELKKSKIKPLTQSYLMGL
jgi:hypothetical protein